MLSQEAVAALVESNNASARAMHEMAETFKKKFEKEGKDRFSEASKVIKFPEVFEPKTHEDEIAQWQDWRLTFRSWLFYAQEAFAKDLDTAEDSKDSLDFVEMSAEQHARSEQLHSILVSLLRNRPLKILRGVEGRNGLEAWRQLSRQLAPRTRARSIGLLQAYLNHPNFVKEKTMVEQILGFERLAEEYANVAKENIGDSTQLSVLLRVIPNHLRQHLQMQLSEDASYTEMREKVLSYERTTTSFSAQNLYHELRIKDQPKQDEPTPMEIDRVAWKGKDKGKKGKGKSFGKDGKSKGKGKPYGKVKGKDKSKGKDKGKNDGKGKGKLAYDACKLCGERGHWGRECPTRALRQVRDDASTVATQSMVSGSSSDATQQAPVVPNTQTAVRRIEMSLDEEDEIAIIEYNIMMVVAEEDKVFDMTYSDSDEDWHVCGVQDRGGDAYFENFKDAHEEPYVINYEVGSSSLPGMDAFVRGIGKVALMEVVLDSGADMSVLPLSFKGIGAPMKGRRSTLKDAQGNVMEGGSMRQAVIIMSDDVGNQILMKETFALASVSEPLLALGKLLKKGWRVNGQQLTYGAFNKRIRFRHNSLVTDVVIRKVDEEPNTETMVRTVAMTFEGQMNDKVKTPGWQLSLDRKVPFLVVPFGVNFKDCFP